MERGLAVLVAATAVAFFGAMAAVMIWMMAFGGPWHGHMWGWSRGSAAPQTPVASQAESFTVEMREFAFWPDDLTVAAGTTVTWANRDGVPHDATADDGQWKTEFLYAGDSEAVTFDSAGTYPYHCTIHPQMTGTVAVQ